MLNEPDATLSPEKRYDVPKTVPDNDNKPVEPVMEPTYKILIADDHPLFREAISSVISTGFDGSTIIETADLDSALDITRENDDLDLILLDSVMPTIDGVEFLQLIRSLNLKHPVVFFTGHGTEELRAMTREFDVLDLLDKQADRHTLPERLRELYAIHVAGGVNPLDSLDAPRAAS